LHFRSHSPGRADLNHGLRHPILAARCAASRSSVRDAGTSPAPMITTQAVASNKREVSRSAIRFNLRSGNEIAVTLAPLHSTVEQAPDAHSTDGLGSRVGEAFALYKCLQEARAIP
jgi:hypothetical protein